MQYNKTMQEAARPNPDELLARVQRAEAQQARGALKIFIGYAAGVGKTYTMLAAAHQRAAQGVDVVVGVVETHGRAETTALLDGLEILPRKQIEYRGVTLAEFDVDAVLARRPQLALVDELAHTNAPGSRHPKRFLDVEELLDAGINVYATLNIQHLESLNDVVAQITNIQVRETVPDRILDEANELELVDLPPDELMQRLREGKVYVPEQAAHAIQKFFRKGNLTALRELTMRRAAERVDDQMRDYMQARAIPGPWRASERLLVCLSAGPFGEKLARSARQLADELNAEWFAVYVETPDGLKQTETERDQFARTQQLAETLGGKIQTLQGKSVAPTVLEFARKHNITKIIVGKPLKGRWREILFGSVVDTLIRASGNIDVYVISGEPTAPRAAPKLHDWLPHTPYRRYLYAALLTGGVTLLSHLLTDFFERENLVMLYLLVVVMSAVSWGRGPAALASLLSVLAFDFFFVPPFFTFAVSDTQYIFTFIGLFVVGLVISQLAARVREQIEAARERELEAETLYNLSRALAVLADLDAILETMVAQVGETFGRQVAVLLPDATKRLQVRAASPGLALHENDMAVAMWSFEHAQLAGRGTDTLPAAKIRCLPLKTARGTLGVLGTMTAQSDGYLSAQQRRMLDSFASLAALALERAQLADAAQNAQVLEATEKLQTALLNSVSHDLRTPLVSITGALTSLQEDGGALDDAARQALVDNARQEAERLNRIVGNLLDMTRLSSGALFVKREPAEMQDVIGAALEQLHGRLDDRVIRVNVPPDLVVALDFGLIVQVLVNLIDNARKYSPRDTPIEINARVERHNVEIEIADRGAGIPPQDLEYVFDRFYRVQHPNRVGGTGMGLSICKGIVEAHGGAIRAENRAGGGALLAFTLPLQS